MSTALCIPVRGQLHETKGVWGLFKAGFSGEVYVVDALGDKETEVFLQHLWGQDLIYESLKGESFFVQLNVLWQNAQQHDILIFAHNDTYLYGNWQKEVEEAFQNKEVGFICALGVRGTLLDGGRIDVVSNMLEAELHGRRLLKQMFVTHGDGFFLAFREKALEDVKGFDAYTYKRFHFYDRDICLSILQAGYKGLYVPISCHHRSGLTACSSEYQQMVNRVRKVKTGGDKLDHDENMQAFNEKWADKLPVMVDEKGEFIGGDFKKWK